MSQRTFLLSSGGNAPLQENATTQNSHGLHRSPSSGLLNRANAASRPGSPSSSGVVHNSNSGSTTNSLSNGNSGTSNTAYDSNLVGGSKGDSYFPPLSSSSASDHSLTVGNSGYSKRSKFNGGLYPLSSTKRWKWWNYIAAVLLVFALVEGLILLIGSTVLYSLPDQIQIDSRDFRKVDYQGLALDPTTTYKKPIQVYHITKEFGAASMGGLGMVVTALASAQQRARSQKVNIVMPYYSMIKSIPGIIIQPHITLPLNVKDKRGRTESLLFSVHKFKYSVPSQPSDFDQDKRAITPVTVWLIGPGSVYPFDRAFESKNVQEIYYSPKGLPSEWKDLYFSKAVATFIQHQNGNKDISLFAAAARRQIDVVHVHGATNAFVLHYLQQFIDKGAMGEEPPAMIYTLHDYLDELQYSNEIVNVQKFMEKGVHSEDDDEEDMNLQMEGISPYCHGHRMFTSAMGIDLADAVTFVSKTMAKDIVEGRLDFYLKELVLGSVLHQAEKNLFVGITNGVDFGKLNPWTMLALRQHKLTFPSNERMGLGAGGITLDSADTGDASSPNPTIRSAKEAAKRFLHSKGLLSEQDLSRPLVLFIGRFQYNKGLEFFTTASQTIKENDGKFVIMGQPNNFPVKSVNNLERLFKDTVTVISDPETQNEWGAFWRTAADFLLVPSLTESFGLVAAEGLLFGSTVISSGVGGLSEFLVDRPNVNDLRQQIEQQEAEMERQYIPLDQQVAEVPREERFNSYLFDAFATDSHSQLVTAINEAIVEWKRLQGSPKEHEEFLTRLVTSALSMGWERPDGPVSQYRALYEIALNAIGSNSQSV
ncbi:hypothetical protein BGZ80_008970 [Entomortierella chlamydospora]|uniref:Starch synthase catalytic domain-containing protein n=1 Tax=Entomortierella chlamydospora TaxID=101097 RepID=A0A9P6T0T4_9FUNG|nr:hypothetical protein BGZ79_010022 [Entomortierella chlamydospora]KAG0016743.1 hypothetical protein BGZ80_008970 [Entomortierella chlamydospora]